MHEKIKSGYDASSYSKNIGFKLALHGILLPQTKNNNLHRNMIDVKCYKTFNKMQVIVTLLRYQLWF